MLLSATTTSHVVPITTTEISTETTTQISVTDLSIQATTSQIQTTTLGPSTGMFTKADFCI